jgi:hypothetical protein
MTRLAGQIEAEVLRMVYAFSTSRWPEALVEVAVVALIVTFGVAAWRLRNGVGPNVPRPVTSIREKA